MLSRISVIKRCILYTATLAVLGIIIEIKVLEGTDARANFWTIEEPQILSLGDVARFIGKNISTEIICHRKCNDYKLLFGPGRYEWERLLDEVCLATGMKQRRIRDTVFLVPMEFSRDETKREIEAITYGKIRPIMQELQSGFSRGLPLKLFGWPLLISGKTVPFAELTPEQQHYLNQGIPLSKTVDASELKVYFEPRLEVQVHQYYAEGVEVEAYVVY